jgi:hypothetical protein
MSAHAESRHLGQRAERYTSQARTATQVFTLGCADLPTLPAVRTKSFGAGRTSAVGALPCCSRQGGESNAIIEPTPAVRRAYVRGFQRHQVA